MMKFNILYLYYDLMNLYGENGNVLALKKHLENQGLKVNISYKSLKEKKDISKYDLIYIGSGNDEAFNLALSDLLDVKEEIKKAFLDNKFFIVTGNALDLFGKSYTNKDNQVIKTLDIFQYEAYETLFRIVGEQTFKFKYLEEEVIGFQNRSSVLKNVKERNLFQVINGTGYVPKANFEGIWERNFYGSYLLGPLLIRNPYFTNYLIKEILKSKDITYKDDLDPLEVKAYTEYKKNLLND